MSVPDFNIELIVRLGVFVSVFFLIGLWKVAAPCRKQAFGRWVCCPANLGIVVRDTLLLRRLLPTGAIGAGLLAQS